MIEIINKSISAKLTVIIAVLLLISISTNIIISSLFFNKISVSNTENETSLILSNSISKIESVVNKYFTVLDTHWENLKIIKNQPGFKRELTRDYYTELFSIDESIVGAYITILPGKFDGQNERFSGVEGYYDDGRFNEYMFKDNGQILRENVTTSFEDALNEFGSDWFLIPKETKENAVFMDIYNQNGKDILILSVIYAIVENGEFIGIAGIDFAYDFIQKEAMKVKESLFEGNSSILILDNDGNIVADTDEPTNVGKELKEIYPDKAEEVLVSIKNGDKLDYENNGLYNKVMPISFVDTNNKWQVRLEIPSDIIRKEARNQILRLSLVGIFLILISIYILFIVSRKMLKPLESLSAISKKIAEGDLSQSIVNKSNDEVGVLTNSFNVMIVRLKELIQAFKDSIQEIEFKNIELKDKEEKFRQLFEKAVDAILLIDVKGFIFDCNESATSYFLLTKKELVGKNITELSPIYQENFIDSETKAQEYLNKTLENKPQNFEWIHQNSKAELFTVSISLNKISLSGKNYVQAILRDISRKKQIDAELDMYRRKLEQLVADKTVDLQNVNNKLLRTNDELNERNTIIHNQNQELKSTLMDLKEAQTLLLHSEKMASLGVLTSGVAHEINNPLNYIMGAYEGLTELLSEISFSEAEDYEHVKVLLDAIKVGVNRSTAIVKSLNQFSRKSESYDEECNIHEILDNSLIMLHKQYVDFIVIQKEYANNDLIIKGNVGNLHQAFINILGNAIQSINEKGKIKIKTSINNENMYVEIIDNGSGISRENLVKITDPFFTTKSPGKGTGLGLSITYNILKEHNAKMTFNSELGKGTSVKLTFAISEA